MDKTKILLLSLSIFSMHAMEQDIKYGNENIKENEFRYFADVIKEKESLIATAPLALKQWFETIKQNKKTKPALVYGAHNVDKLKRSEALVLDAKCTLCRVGLYAMRLDWLYKPFNQECLEKLPGTVCVIIDNIRKPTEEDVKNLESLVTRCNAKNNLHLLVIADQKEIPAHLYTQFQPIEFPVPAESERLQLLKKALASGTLADDVDENFFTHFNEQLSNYTPRDIAQIAKKAIKSALLKKSKISKLDLEKAFQRFEQDKKNKHQYFFDDYK